MEAALDALGNPMRREILRKLRAAPMSVGALADRLPVSRPAVSRHLRVLSEAGLVSVREEGTRALYSVRVEGLAPVREFLDDFWDTALARLEQLAHRGSIPPDSHQAAAHVSEVSSDVLEKSVLLHVSAEIAFALFTEQASLWWPESRRHTQDPQSSIALLASGRFWERASDGREVELGRVLTWEPPRRIVLAFYPGTDPAHPTEVTVRFVPEPGGTRVKIEHRPTPASAELWKQRVSRFAASWDEVLPALAAHAHRA